MCTATMAQRILNALQARLNNLSVFTAHDVTIDARDTTDENVRHSEVRNIVHNEFLTGQFPANYNREEFLDLTNGHTAICYYPDGKSPYDHPMAMAAPSQAPAPTTNVSTQVTASTRQGGNVKDGDGYICTVTKENRINVPKDITDKVSLNGGTIDINVVGQAMIYRTPNKDGRIRISSTELGGGSKFRLEVDNNTIKIEQI